MTPSEIVLTAAGVAGAAKLTAATFNTWPRPFRCAPCMSVYLGIAATVHECLISGRFPDPEVISIPFLAYLIVRLLDRREMVI